MIWVIQKDTKKHLLQKQKEIRPLFSKFIKNYKNISDNSESTLTITTQDSTNDKYFKLYNIDTELVEENIDTLKNTLNFTTRMMKYFLVLIRVFMRH